LISLGCITGKIFYLLVLQIQNMMRGLTLSMSINVSTVGLLLVRLLDGLRVLARKNDIVFKH
jgi:hypothetical protein